MANFRAPGIQIKEVDISEVVAPAGTSVGALVGPAYAGPTNRRVLVTNDKNFVQTFGQPISGHKSEYHYYAGIEFLQESGFMYYVRSTTSADTVGGVRVINTTGTSAISATTVSEGKSSTVLATEGYEDGNKANKYYAVEENAPASDLFISALGPGKSSKNIAISIVTSASTSTSGLGFDYGYNWEGKYPSDYGYYRINVYTKNDVTTNADAGWVTGSSALSAVIPDESFIVSNTELAKDFEGNTLYAPDVINGVSKYIYIKTDGTNLSTDLSANGIVPFGTGSVSMIGSDIAGAWGLFSSREASTPNILMGPYDPATQSTDNIAVAEIAKSRRDCIAVVGTGAVSATNVTNIVDGKESAFNSSYVAMYAGGDLISDNYSGKNIYVPKSVFAGALLARNDNIANVWNAPAGLTRGAMPSLGQYKIFNESEIGFLYNYNINTSKRIRGTGDIMWGQKTGQTKKSALDRINVRRLLLFIENTLEPSLLAYMFENNNDKTRSRVKANVDGFLRTIFAGGGLVDFSVVCDETNNTSQVIDNNELAIDIYIQPTKTIEFINVQIIITRTGVSFAEVI